MKAIKAYFITRLLREKILLMAFALILVGVWGSSFMTRGGVALRDVRAVSTDLSDQNLWLARKQNIENAARQAIGRLEPGRTLDSTKLLAEVNKIATETGLTSNTTVEDTKSEQEPSGQFTVHSLRFTVRKADYGTLVKFYSELQKRTPYIGLEQFTIQADRTNPAQLSAVLKLTSVEVRR